MSIRKPILASALLVLVPAVALAWGANGHRIVGKIAEGHLSATAAAGVAAILGQDSLAEVSTWPDFIRSDPDWRHAAPWHFISIDDDESFDDLERDDRGDILTQLAASEALLRDAEADPEARWQALAWMVHLVGDIHQPLHVGRRDDRGGNRVHVHWFEEISNLHSVWDSKMIEHEELSFTEYASFLDRPDAETLAAWQAGSYLDWARESFEVRSQVYDFADLDLGYDYAFQQKTLLDRRLSQAGVRLAGALNAIFAPATGDGPAE